MAEKKRRLVVVLFKGPDNRDFLDAIPQSAISSTLLVEASEIMDKEGMERVGHAAMTQIRKQLLTQQ